ncbi:guard cell S-type anion channel SLAC1 [Selaginella moellendorffii]|nr:guard cell S-type anion channel SLAC1 [Selaginella moellendorffii]|eukprot:XP_002973316.2 guard cell S-type anion channel SLAC1 [Selaginella moellendorffii]
MRAILRVMGRSDPLDESPEKQPEAGSSQVDRVSQSPPQSPPTSTSYNLFKTRSSKSLEKQIPWLSKQNGDAPPPKFETDEELPAGRFFDALQGPELEVLKDSEDLLLPLDQKWPFLLRVPANVFGVSIGLSAQSLLWAEIHDASSLSYLKHVPKGVLFALWSIGVFVHTVLFSAYALKCVFYFEAVRREFHHPVRVNYFFAPWVAAMLLALSTPKDIAKRLHPWLLGVFMGPVFALEVKIYGQWLFGGERRLSKVANPTTHLALTGNFVGSLLSHVVGWKEFAIFLFAVGLAHYVVLFVTLYQRLPTNETLPKELHPVFFLFIAAPSIASEAWEMLAGSFDYPARLIHFVGLFLFISLIVRLNFFRGFRFSIAWWAYTFPVAAIAMTANRYGLVVSSWLTDAMTSFFIFLSVAIVACVLVLSILHAVLWGTLLPNDMAIAITTHKKKKSHSQRVVKHQV